VQYSKGQGEEARETEGSPNVGTGTATRPSSSLRYLAQAGAVQTKHEKIEHWTKVLAEQRGSGMSIAAFCRENELPAWKFYYWRKGLVPCKSGFVQIQCADEHGSGVCIRWDGDGCALWYKRLEKGRFRLAGDGQAAVLERRHLLALLEGVTPLKYERTISLNSG
jgi:hypothetical protein